ncbi:hypothetical protein [Aggregatilinea lenta]|uniref:hypothetical protein n=1 Tax=Aggregatilinea lenta TaxID=913108 RepID=UPI000E5A1D37|nr:hypothetical protein [Aggregatilinea lenta]
MVTWKLFVYAFLGWGASDNAIFVRDANHEPVWRDVLRRITRFRAAWLLIGLFLGIVGILYARHILFFFVPPLLIFALALALTLGPVVVEERTKSRWEFLLAVPYDMRTVLLGKAGGALWHIRFLTYAISMLLMCASAVVGITSVALIPESLSRTSGWYSLGLWGVLLITPVLGSLLFIFDRMQHYALLAVAALAAGTTARSIRAALLTAIAVVLVIWVVEIAAAEAFLTLEHGEVWRLNTTRILSVATLGPTAAYISQMELSHAALCTGGTLLVREALIASVWRWALHSARQSSGLDADR